MRRALALAAALVASLMCVSGAAAAGGDLRIGSPQAFEHSALRTDATTPFCVRAVRAPASALS